MIMCEDMALSSQERHRISLVEARCFLSKSWRKTQYKAQCKFVSWLVSLVPLPRDWVQGLAVIN